MGEQSKRVKAIYRKNLRMSEAKVAAQVGHALIGLGVTDPLVTIIVLRVSDRKFYELTCERECYSHADFGFTEVEPGTVTAAAWIEKFGESA